MPSFRNEKFYTIALALVLGVSAYLYWPYLFAERMWSDEGYYCWFGKRIFSDFGLIFSRETSEMHPPLFSVFLALMHFLLPSEFACRFTGFIFYLLGIFFIFEVGRRISGYFVGAFAAITLAFSYPFFWTATMVLLDVPFTVWFLGFAYTLLRIKERNSMKEDVLVAMAACGAVLFKSAGVMVIPIITLYYSFALREVSFMERLKRMLMPLSLVIGIEIGLVIKNIVQLGHWQFSGTSAGVFRWDIAMKNFEGIVHACGSPAFLLLGAWGIVCAPWKGKILILAWLAVRGVGLLSVSIPLETRFTLYLFPAGILSFSMGVDALSKKILGGVHILGQQAICGVLFLALFYQLLPFRDELASRDKFFTGYKAAAQIVKKEYHPGMLVLAGSERQLRYHTGINYHEFGGDMMMFRQDKPDFKKLIQVPGRDVLLVVDRWEVLQPAWAFPMSRDAADYLRELGFRIVALVVRPLPERQGLIPKPVIWIFLREESKG